MAIVAVEGDASTTTAVALAAAWPASDDTVLVEADASGGDLAAWFDLPVPPSLSTVVTTVLDGAWQEIERYTRLAPNGLRLIPAPALAAEAAVAVDQSARSLVPVLATLRTPIAIADTGRSTDDHPFAAAAAVDVVVHRQSTQSARAAAVRLQRLAARLETLTGAAVVAVVGSDPYGPDEIGRFVTDAVGETPVVALPVDPLAAAVIGGRTGVSERRLARLPLMRAAGALATEVERLLARSAAEHWRATG